MTNVKDSLNPPLLPSSVVERPEVNKAIDDAFRSDVIFMHAPAGFGKTIAMSSWLLARGRPTAWIPLTVYDDEPVVFCRYLLTALASLESGAAVAGVADAASAALNDPGFYEAPFEFLFQAITGLSTNKNRGVIVIDDFHLVKNTAILNKLPLLVSKLSQHLKLAFISRLNPPLSFADLALKGRLGEISESDLRFTSRQIMLLYQACGVDLSPAQAKTIADKTGGWALGLGAELLAVKARGSDSFMSQAAGERYIDSYLESEIWDNWDGETRVFLLRTSILEDLPPELCDRFCGGDSNRLLTRLMHESGLVVRLADGTFRYHHILRDFLRRQAVFLGTDLSGDYIVAADYLYARDNLNAAFDCYMKSGDQGAIIGFLAKIVDYGATTGSVEEYYNSINSYLYGKLPEELIEQNPFMLAPCVWLSLLSGDIMRFQHWMAKLQGFFDGDQTGIEQAGVEQADGDQAGVDPRFLAAITLFQFPNPLNSPRDILRYASARFDLMDFQSVPSPSVTYNLPYFHRGHRDYSDLAGEWEELVPQYVAAFNAISDNAISLIMDGVVSGLLYEQNKLPQAKQKAVEVLTRLDERSHPELWFSAYMHLAAIAFAEGEQEAAWDAISQAQAVIEKRGRYLQKNLSAVMLRYRLLLAEPDQAREWLSRYAIGEDGDIRLYQIYQVFATIRASIALGDHVSALALMSRLEGLVVDYRRPLDQIEIYALRAIVLWREGLRPDALASLEKAVLLAEPYGFIRPLADEGAALIPILDRLYRRLCVKPERSETATFVRIVLLAAHKVAESFPHAVENHGDKPVKLSKQQARMLQCLAAGMNNRQICEETGLKLNTVKAHLYKLYEKLDVHSSTDAVLKSYRLGLIEIKAD